MNTNNNHKARRMIILITAILTAAIFTARAAESSDTDLLKVESAGNTIEFSQKDITNCLKTLKNLAGIRITGLPDTTEGRLKLGNTAVSAGDEISLKNISDLKFIPASFKEISSGFTFVPVIKGGISDKVVNVGVTLVKGANKPPATTGLKLETFSSMPLMGRLNAYEPDGDRIFYRISEYPDKGDLELDERSGVFVFYPFDGKTGSDSFKWYAFDEYGNISKKTKVNIKISKIGNSLTFSDMIDSAAHYQALTLAKEGIMSATNTQDGYLFAPDEEMTRAEFITSAVKALGDKVDNTVKKTPFADDGEIDEKDKPYILFSIKNEIVNGYPNGSLANLLKPNDSISRDEAAVILDRLLKIEDAVPSSTASSSLTPAWARQAVINLKTNGIMADSAYETLTREASATLLFESMRYKEASKKPDLLFWAK